MEKRGWTVQEIENVLSNPAQKIATRDRRHLPGGATHNQPATAYLQADGHYAIRNDITGDIVQISDRFDPNWIRPF